MVRDFADRVSTLNVLLAWWRQQSAQGAGALEGEPVSESRCKSVCRVRGRCVPRSGCDRVDRLGSLVVENALLGGRKVSIHCAGGVIADIRDDGGDLAVAQGGSTDRLDGRGCLVAPGLINAHTHAAMTVFRGRADDLPLMEWLERHIWPYEEVMTEDEVYAGARLGILEMVRNGTTFFNDMYWSSRGTARAAVEMGIRACIGEVFIDGAADAISRRRLEIERLLDELEGCSSRVSLSVDPHCGVHRFRGFASLGGGARRAPGIDPSHPSGRDRSGVQALLGRARLHPGGVSRSARLAGRTHRRGTYGLAL